MSVRTYITIRWQSKSFFNDKALCKRSSSIVQHTDDAVYVVRASQADEKRTLDIFREYSFAQLANTLLYLYACRRVLRDKVGGHVHIYVHVH